MLRYLQITNLVLPKNQAGVVLLAFLLVLIVGSSYAVLSALNSQQAQSTNKTIQALNIAKQALISFSVNFPDRPQKRGPGYLPCPDNNNDGGAEGTCSATDIAKHPTIGWLPFKTLELRDLRDHSGARLWYAVSANHRSFLKSSDYLVNSETEGTLTVDRHSNVDGHSNIVAIVIAPGRILEHQARVTPSNDSGSSTHDVRTDIGKYLEGDNAALTNHFVTTLGEIKIDNAEYDADGAEIFNDQVVFITQQELMKSVEKRVLGEIRQVFSRYQASPSYQASGQYPWLAPFANPSDTKLTIAPDAAMVDCTFSSDANAVFRAQAGTYFGHIPLCDENNMVIESWFPKWFIVNNWHHLTYIAYAREDPPGGSTVCAIDDCLQIEGLATTNKIRALAVLAGASLPEHAQIRPSNELSNYFEGENASPLDGVFQHKNTAIVSNDQITIIPTASISTTP